jgi:hypothetical protein
MRSFQYLLVAILSVSFFSTAFAAPPRPWLAVAAGHNLFSSNSSCVRAASRTLNKQGFARVSSTGSTVLGAYRSGSDYQYKVAIKCLAGSRSAVAFVTTTLSGKGLKKANSLISGLRSQTYTSSYSAPEEADEDEVDEVFNVDVSEEEEDDIEVEEFTGE